jgi:bacterioferritin-associated ferredoxin
MFICICFSVTDKAIKQAVLENGVGNMRQLKIIWVLAHNVANVFKQFKQSFIALLPMRPYLKRSVNTVCLLYEPFIIKIEGQSIRLAFCCPYF